MKICIKCQRTLPLSEFSKPYTDSHGRTYQRSYCKECNRKVCSNYGKQNRKRHTERWKLWRKNNPQLSRPLDRRKKLKFKYGLTVQQFEDLVKKQDGKCAICGQAKPLNVDHNHETEIVRGLLCTRCNTTLGVLDRVGIGSFANYLGRRLWE